MSTEVIIPEGTSISTYRDYSPAFKAAAIAAYEISGNKLRETARNLEIPFQLLDYWVRTANRSSRFLTDAREELANECEDVAWKVTGLAKEQLDDPNTRMKIPFAALMTGGAIAIDKMNVLRLQPTSIVATVNYDDLEQAKQAVQAIAADERLTLYDAAARLISELADVPELAAQIRAWADGSLQGK